MQGDLQLFGRSHTLDIFINDFIVCILDPVSVRDSKKSTGHDEGNHYQRPHDNLVADVKFHDL